MLQRCDTESIKDTCQIDNRITMNRTRVRAQVTKLDLSLSIWGAWNVAPCNESDQAWASTLDSLRYDDGEASVLRSRTGCSLFKKAAGHQNACSRGNNLCR